ncbi:hypothetical protein MBLNU13_g10278t1 [Cladosporium sp. NU13]
MSVEGNMDEVETDIIPDVDGDIGADDAVSNGDLANRRRRQQVRQACQQCRRRKIKVDNPAAPFTKMPSSNLIVQCDEVRPVCRPCVKARLACAYELPPGQTRAQAMIESQQRLREELHSHSSLIHALRCTDANSSIQMLNRLRHGDYDSALLGTDLASRPTSQESRTYPWEECIDESQRQRTRDTGMLLPPIENYPPGRHDSGPHHATEKHDLPYDRNQGLPQTFAPAYPGPSGSQIIPGSMVPPNMHAYDSRIPSYPRPELQYQPRPNPNYQQQEMTHPPLPSNDPNRSHQGPR